jgi:hypothetical protein
MSSFPTTPGSTAGCGRHGFTLIEMMIAVTLGMAVVYVAFAGFRVAAQSVALANRLATENSILRAGMTVALNDTDFWTSHDDPFDAANAQGRQPLRAAPAMVAGKLRGLPFTPFQAAHAVGAYPLASDPIVDAYVPSAPWLPQESASGWNPNAWTATESRSWAWGNLAERTPQSSMPVPAKHQTMGYYHWFSTIEPSTAPDPATAHSWQQRQLEGLKSALGYYGLFDYMPSNTGLMVYDKANASGKWAVSLEWCYAGSDKYFIGNDNRYEGLNYAQDLLSATNGNPFIIPSPQGSLGRYVEIAYTRYGTGISLSTNSATASQNSIAKLLVDGTENNAWLPENAKPAHWPSLDVSALRFIRTNTFVCLNRIRWTSPLTGQASELSFTAYGTTLRGARQQRKRDAVGWADPFASSPAADPNLDTY